MRAGSLCSSHAVVEDNIFKLRRAETHLSISRWSGSMRLTESDTLIQDGMGPLMHRDVEYIFSIFHMVTYRVRDIALLRGKVTTWGLQDGLGGADVWNEIDYMRVRVEEVCKVHRKAEIGREVESIFITECRQVILIMNGSNCGVSEALSEGWECYRDDTIVIRRGVDLWLKLCWLWELGRWLFGSEHLERLNTIEDGASYSDGVYSHYQGCGMTLFSVLSRHAVGYGN
ncbi:hypothetical protein Tco_0064060 [Tanacetum coccineum]